MPAKSFFVKHLSSFDQNTAESQLQCPFNFASSFRVLHMYVIARAQKVHRIYMLSFLFVILQLIPTTVNSCLVDTSLLVGHPDNMDSS